MLLRFIVPNKEARFFNLLTLRPWAIYHRLRFPEEVGDILPHIDDPTTTTTTTGSLLLPVVVEDH
jgi:hypothetical protein